MIIPWPIPISGGSGTSTDPGADNVKKGVTYKFQSQNRVGLYDLSLVTVNSNDGPVDAAIDGLVNYLKGIDGLTVLTEWPYGNQKIAFPTVTIFTKKPKRVPLANPEQISLTDPDDNNQVIATVAVAMYDIPMQLDLWCRNKLERRQFTNALLAAFNVQEAQGDMPDGLSLQLTNYFNVFARYEIDDYEFKDDEIAAERQERRTMIQLMVNTRECISKTSYAITQTTVYQETSSENATLTDDQQNTESKEYF